MSTETNNSGNPVPVFKKVQTAFGALGVIGVLGLLAAFVMDQKAFYSSFMFGFVFWMSLTLGACTLTFLHHSIRAKWSVSILRVIESANKLIPVMFVFWLILMIGMWTNVLYQWNNPDIVRASEVLQRKQWYLNPMGWTIRGFIYFAYWWFMTNKLNASSRKQDETRDNQLAADRANWGAPGGVIHVVLLTFAWTDWVMSLDPVWYSTIYGVWWMVFGVRMMIATGIIVTLSLVKYRPFNEAITKVITKDIGNMLLGFTMLWAYITLSQFLIIWSGNLPEEIPFFINRFNGPMVYVGAFLVVFQFFVPFLALVSGRTKREPTLLLFVARMVVCVSIIDVFWQITPFFKVGLSMENLPGYLLDFGAWAGIGGIWMWIFLGNLIKFGRENALLPLHDTRLQEDKIYMESHHA